MWTAFIILCTGYLPVSSKSLLDSSSIFIWNMLSSCFFLPSPNLMIFIISTIFTPVVPTPFSVCPRLRWILSASKVIGMVPSGLQMIFFQTYSSGPLHRAASPHGSWVSQNEHSKKENERALLRQKPQSFYVSYSCNVFRSIHYFCCVLLIREE